MLGEGGDFGEDEYLEGRVTESDRFMTETGMDAKFDLAEAEKFSDTETVKFGHSQVSQSRQREEHGARESAAEVSPERPNSSFLSDQ